MEKMQVRPSEGNNKLQYHIMDFLTLLFFIYCKIAFCFDF